jgi:PPM family protein phosphatase
MEMRLYAGGSSVVGKVRKRNEDAFRIYLDQPFVKSSKRPIVAAVADGIGSYRAGDEAANISVDQLSQFYYISPPFFTGEQTLKNLIYKANDNITDLRKNTHGRYGMGCTLTVAMIDTTLDKLLLFHAGDSSCYLLRGENMVMLTTRHQDNSGALTMHMGVGNLLKLERVTVKLLPTDVLMLCSDGLDGYVHKDRIQKILINEREPMTAAKALTDEADALAGKDNSTVIVLRQGP